MKKGIIWGTGKMGKRAYLPLVTKYEMNIIAYVDNCEEKRKDTLYGLPIVAGEDINDLEYDLVFIAVYDYKQIADVERQLEQLGIPSDRVIELATNLNYIDVFMTQRFEWIKDYAQWLKESSVGGAIAECGVFRGDSAKFLNIFFEDRKLYLFDTFEGFVMQDINQEKKINSAFETSKFNSNKIFKNTTIDFVMKKMKYPENVIIKQGIFPDSTEGIEEKFCFVNLDMDLYIPMLGGLRFFWDKLKTHGCILLHDYCNSDLSGVREAVKTFEEERKIVIPKTPIGDGCSMALLKY